MRRKCLVLPLSLLILWPFLLAAAEHKGTVRAADQFLPGATLVARQGGAEVVAFTDENGRYALNLTPGVWEIRVEMFGFTPAHEQITVGAEPSRKEWTLDMPRVEERDKTAAVVAPAKAPEPAKKAETPAAPPAVRAAPKGSTHRPGFQNASVTVTAEGQQALAEAANQVPNAGPGSDIVDAAEDSMLVSGSTSGGLAASGDEEDRRQRSSPGGSAGSGSSGMRGSGIPPGMEGGRDVLGLGGLGASAINGGFGDFGDGGPGFGPPGGSSSKGGNSGRGSSRGSSSRGRGASTSSRKSKSKSGSRGPYSGQYSSFGNKRRTQPSYTGSIYTSLNNSALNAAPYSLNGRVQPKPSYAQSRFGISFGGPLQIPKLVQWQRASFYVSYTGRRSRNPFSELSSVPTAAERAGDFSQARATVPVSIFQPCASPCTPQPFPGNIIPASLFSANKAVTGLMQYIPLPSYGGLVQNYRFVTSYPNTSDSLSVRLNAPLSRKDRLTFNIQTQTRNSENPQLFGFRDDSTGSGMSASLSWSHSFAPRVNSSASLSLSRNNNRATPFFAYGENVAAALGIVGTSQDPVNYGPPNLSFTNFGSLSDGGATVGRNQTISFNDHVTYVVKKKHNLTAGFSYRRLQQNSLAYQNARGSFSFSGLLTSNLDDRGQPVARTGFDFADFLLGMPQTSSRRFGSDNNYFRSWSASGYAQDDYRISRSLSLNVGLRYEYFAPYTELHGRLASLDVSPGFTAASLVTPGMPAPYSGSLPASLVRSDPNNYSPRIGIAWRPGKKRGPMFRGGYSIFYSGASYIQVATQMASQPPFATTSSISTSNAFPLTIQNGFPVVPAQTLTNTYAIDPDYRLAYAQNWNLAVQNTFAHGLFVELDYIGTKGTDLSIVEQPNRATSGTVTDAQQNLKIKNAGGFTYQTAGANSSYNAGQVRVTRRFSRGMSGSALYMYAKAIDNASSFNGLGGTTVQFLDNLGLERGLSTFDQRHRLQTTYLLSSPVGIHGMMRNGGWKTTVLTGWTLSGSFAAASGTPLTARVSGNLANTGGIAAFGNTRAQATGLPVKEDGNAYFNPLAFTTPIPGQYGNAGRNTIPGLFNMSMNASLGRYFRFGDTKRRLQLRLSATNALNHVVIRSIGTTVNSATYGLPTAASETRVVSLYLRFNF